MLSAAASYNAVPPVYAPPQAGEPAAASAASSSSSAPQSAAQAKLEALKARLSAARQSNHKEAVEEDRRNKLGPEALKRERAEKAWEKKKGEAAAETETDKLLGMTAADAAASHDKRDKKQRRVKEFGYDVYNNEAQYRHYKKTVRRAGDAGKISNGGDEDGGAPDDDPGDYDPLDYGRAPPVAKERVQALMDDMHEQAVRRANWSRRRTFDESKDVTYINKRNEVYNKKIERAFDPYTVEIKANLERGTAL